MKCIAYMFCLFVILFGSNTYATDPCNQFIRGDWDCDEDVDNDDAMALADYCQNLYNDACFGNLDRGDMDDDGDVDGSDAYLLLCYIYLNDPSYFPEPWNSLCWDRTYDSIDTTCTHDTDYAASETIDPPDFSYAGQTVKSGWTYSAGENYPLGATYKYGVFCKQLYDCDVPSGGGGSAEKILEVKINPNENFQIYKSHLMDIYGSDPLVGIKFDYRVDITTARHNCHTNCLCVNDPHQTYWNKDIVNVDISNLVVKVVFKSGTKTGYIQKVFNKDVTTLTLHHVYVNNFCWEYVATDSPKTGSVGEFYFDPEVSGITYDLTQFNDNDLLSIDYLSIGNINMELIAGRYSTGDLHNGLYTAEFSVKNVMVIYSAACY